MNRSPHANVRARPRSAVLLPVQNRFVATKSSLAGIHIFAKTPQCAEHWRLRPEIPSISPRFQAGRRRSRHKADMMTSTHELPCRANGRCRSLHFVPHGQTPFRNCEIVRDAFCQILISAVAPHPHGESRRRIIPQKTKATITIAAFQLRRLGLNSYLRVKLHVS